MGSEPPKAAEMRVDSVGFNSPEFEEKPVIEGINEKEGLLVDEQFNKVAGVLIVYPLGSGARMVVRFRSTDIENWRHEEEDYFWGIVDKLVGDCWNEKLDTNGYNLSEPFTG